MVVSEIHKWVQTSQLEAELSFYRTQSGMELDLLIKTHSGQAQSKLIGLEIKSRETVVKKDWSNMARIAAELKDEWKGGLVVHRGNRIVQLDSTLNI